MRSRWRDSRRLGGRPRCFDIHEPTLNVAQNAPFRMGHPHIIGSRKIALI